MSPAEAGTGPAPPKGLLASLKSLLGGLSEIFETRRDLLLTELEEGLGQAKQVLLLAVISFLCLGLGFFFLTVFIIVIFWDTHRLLAIGGLTGFYFVLAVITGLGLRKRARSRPKFLSATLSEFAKDRKRLLS